MDHKPVTSEVGTIHVPVNMAQNDLDGGFGDIFAFLGWGAQYHERKLVLLIVCFKNLNDRSMTTPVF